MRLSSRAREWVALGAVAALLALAPLTFGFSGRVPNTLLLLSIYAILALGLNVVLGYTGLLDLGYVTFMATGAAITAAAMVSVADPQTGAWLIPAGGRTVEGARHLFHFPGSLLLVMLFAGLVCAAIGVLRGFPTLHLTGDYYAIVTLGIAEILAIYYRNAQWTGGTKSLSFTPADKPTLLGVTLHYDSPQFYYLVFTLLVLTVLFSLHLRDSRLGRALAAIRLDATAARTCGIPVNRYKMLAFALSGFVGGIGGSLFALWRAGFSSPGVEVWESIVLVAILVLGGMGSIRGAILGAIVMVALAEVLRAQREARFLFYGLILILLMRFRPGGVLPDRPEGDPLSANDRERLSARSTPLFRIGGGPS